MGYTYRGQPRHPALSARQRIVHCAVELFGEHGFDRVTLARIAHHAHVSPPLIVHHFGSKAGLRAACDVEITQQIKDAKAKAIAAGTGMSPDMLVTQMADGAPALRYLFQALVDSTTDIDALVDHLVDDAVDYLDQAEQAGLATHSDTPRHRAALILLWSFGGMILHHHMKRLLGVSVVDDPPHLWGPYLSTALDIYSHGVLTPQAGETLRAATPPTTSTPSPTGTSTPKEH